MNITAHEAGQCAHGEIKLEGTLPMNASDSGVFLYKLAQLATSVRALAYAPL